MTCVKGNFVEIVIFTASVLAYLYFMFKIYDIAEKPEDGVTPQDRGDGVAFRFRKSLYRYLRRLNGNVVMLVFVVLVITEACLLIRLNFVRIEKDAKVYQASVFEFHEKY